MSDHRRLVAHGIHTGQQPGEQLSVADIAHDQLVGVAPGRRPGAVSLWQQRVQQDDLVLIGDELIGDMGPDEPGTAGDQYAHAPTLGAPALRTGRHDGHVTGP